MVAAGRAGEGGEVSKACRSLREGQSLDKRERRKGMSYKVGKGENPCGISILVSDIEE